MYTYQHTKSCGILQCGRCNSIEIYTQIRIIEGNFNTLDEDLRVGPKTACIISVRVQYLRLHINFENLPENYF